MSNTTQQLFVIIAERDTPILIVKRMIKSQN